MIAEVIPLRRRTHERAWERHEGGLEHSGVFDPPPDPEPPEEYSVWERPTAELLRREPPNRSRAVARGRRAWGSVRARNVGSIALVAIAGAVLALPLDSSHRTPPSSPITSVAGGQLGLGAPLGLAAGRTRTARAAHPRSPSSRPRTQRRIARGNISPRSSSREAASEGVLSTPVTPADTRAPQATHTETASAGAVSTPETPRATAAREFGFER
jgi:hypothetical protein